MSEVWDSYCVLDEYQENCINEVIQLTKLKDIPWDVKCKSNDDKKYTVNTENNEKSDNMDGLQSSLIDAESSCRIFIEQLDKVFKVLDEIANSYNDVASRTNSLMINCEHLLEQQVKISYTLFIHSEIHIFTSF